MTGYSLIAAVALLASAAWAAAQPLAPGQGPDALLPRARAILQSSPLIDGHNDYPWEVREAARGDLDKLDISRPQPSLMTDIARLRRGAVGGQFWSVYVPAELAGQAAVTATLEQIDLVHRMVRQQAGTFELALTADDVERVFKGGRSPRSSAWRGGIRSTTRSALSACSTASAPAT